MNNRKLPKEFENLLGQRGLLKEFEEGKLKCACCGDSVNIDNLHGIAPVGEEVKLACNKPQCIEDFHSRIVPEGFSKAIEAYERKKKWTGS